MGCTLNPGYKCCGGVLAHLVTSLNYFDNQSRISDEDGCIFTQKTSVCAGHCPSFTHILHFTSVYSLTPGGLKALSDRAMSAGLPAALLTWQTMGPGKQGRNHPGDGSWESCVNIAHDSMEKRFLSPFIERATDAGLGACSGSPVSLSPASTQCRLTSCPARLFLVCSGRAVTALLCRLVCRFNEVVRTR